MFFGEKQRVVFSLIKRNKAVPLLPFFAFYFFTQLSRRAIRISLLSTVCYKFQQRAQKMNIFHGLLRTHMHIHMNTYTHTHTTESMNNDTEQKYFGWKNRKENRMNVTICRRKGFRSELLCVLMVLFFFFFTFCCVFCGFSTFLWHTINKDKKNLEILFP